VGGLSTYGDGWRYLEEVVCGHVEIVGHHVERNVRHAVRERVKPLRWQQRVMEKRVFLFF
jgi:hypothetical protein